MEKGITVIEASKILGVSRNRVYQLIKKDMLLLNEKNQVTLKSVLDRKENPVPAGRPNGTFKREEK